MAKGYYLIPDSEDRSVYAGRTFFKPPDPNATYLKYYGFYLELSFIASRTTGLDHMQAEKELAKCEEKLARARNHQDFDLKKCLPTIQKLKRDWQRTDIPDRWSR